MGKHERGYQRILRDNYATPAWPTEALLEHVGVRGLNVLEPACGDGSMAEVLKAAGAIVTATDVEDRCYAGLNGLVDFTLSTQLEFEFGNRRNSANRFDAIISNPPYGSRGKLAEAFIQTGLVCMGSGFMAMLLPADFDSAKSRRGLFGRCPKFAGTIKLTRRIKWFDYPGSKSPKENHAWFLWGDVPFLDSTKSVIRYAPEHAYA